MTSMISSRPSYVSPSIEPPRQEFHLSLYNLREIIGKDADGVMIYGIASCCYQIVRLTAIDLIIKMNSISGSNKKSVKPLKKIYNHELGHMHDKQTGPDDRTVIPKIVYHKTRSWRLATNRCCKAGLTNLTIYNTIQAARSKPTIPTIFCSEGSNVDPSQNCTWFITGETILSRTADLNDKISMKEARRVGKLCFDERIDERIRETAQKTIFFVKVTEHLDHDEETNTDHYTYTLSKIAPPWGTTKETINAFKRGLKERAIEKETHPLERAIRRLPDDSIPQNKILKFEKNCLKSELIEALAKTEKLTSTEKEELEDTFDWDVALASDRTFSCLGGKTVQQAYAEKLDAHVKTSCFRQQINEIIRNTLDK
jgi:hypothetical protein